MSDWVRVIDKSKLSPHGLTSIEVDGRRICLASAGGTLFAVDDRCTHAEALLSSGDVEEGEVVCPLHGARFDLKTGEAMTPPATRPVQTHEVKIDGNGVFVRLRGPNLG
ncbi:MAG: non-heme iron oxygenase ferredoxin subunit [Elusimicrobia bacterium]|nr:non-heme iron oxygenase ferredoxin subunit [Elusimicrobiota bacterium]